jgi:hypothetical protein
MLLEANTLKRSWVLSGMQSSMYACNSTVAKVDSKKGGDAFIYDIVMKSVVQLLDREFNHIQ